MGKVQWWHFAILAILLFVARPSAALAVDLTVTGSDGQAVTEYRWVIEEDATYNVVPGVIDPQTLAVKFHTSYMPVVASGDETTPPGALTLDPNKYYYVSILPDAGYTIAGARFAGDAASVQIIANKLPLPTAQISVFVFEDNFPINNAPDLPEEFGLEGFEVIVNEAGGRYGISGGRLMADAFGNPLGTEYDADGNVTMMGTSEIYTDANGEAFIKYLPPAKYGIQVLPPPGQDWVQTSTIEGTKTIDAWVKANEPPFFREFGPPGWHVFIGFVQPMHDTTVLNGESAISGRVVNLHNSRPPDFTFFPGVPFAHTTPWIGLNDLSVGIGVGVHAQRANEDGTFTVPDVPAGNYQLVIWDDYLDLIIASLGVTVPEDGGDVVLGDVPVFNWFTGLQHYSFYDQDEDGFWDDTEVPLPEQAVNLRWRDGTMYQSFPTDMEGFVPFDEVFPFFNWLVAEVDFLRYKATGVTVVVDAGGMIDPLDPWSFGGILTPQPQSENDGAPYRTETGPVLTEAFQGFLGQTSVMLWGKTEYAPGENGGISGIIYYATTRAENDPRYAAAESWEPGIARVQVNLYQDIVIDGQIDDINGVAGVQLADVDNYPFDWSAGGSMGAEDEERSGSDGIFDSGDAILFTTSDSWDDEVPTGCQGDIFYAHGVPTDCYDGLRNFNQVRPGVFDGGYAFGPQLEDGSYLPSGMYIVEAVPPPGYELVSEESKNVDFGDDYTVPLALPPTCVNYDENGGLGHFVPDELELFPGIEAPFANTYRPACDRKQVALTQARNAAADFFMFTSVPIAAHFKGMILDDTANEFDPNSPQFGEKYAPPWMPVSIRDWTGKEIGRVYSDEWGNYNGLVPSTYTVNIASPSGVSPNMITVCLNHPGPIPDPDNPGQSITDPFFNPQYSQFCYTFQYMPGATTYLDTPVVPVAAFAGPDQFPLDCEFPDGTPQIYQVLGPDGGPYLASAPDIIQIQSVGPKEVPNPQYDGPGGTQPKTITRDYGFGGTRGTVRIGTVNLTNVLWAADGHGVQATVPAGTPSGQLSITRGDNGKSTIVAVTVTVGGPEPLRVAAGGSIQAAIDAAAPGDLILVAPGTYEEMVIMWKPVRLQGWGANSTIINAVHEPAEKLQLWRQKVNDLITAGDIDLLPSQEVAGGLEPDTLFTEEGAGIIVLAKNAPPEEGGFGPDPNARIDGFTILGATVGGGVMVNGYAPYLEISNNHIMNNQGVYAGGIRVGHPTLTVETPNGLAYQDDFSDNIRIHNNHITRNGGLSEAGGGILMCTGSDFYEITQNAVCGNFTMGNGAGVAHSGLSQNGQITRNNILFNQSFNQGLSVSGGAIAILGGAPLGGPESLSPGSGSVLINANLIQGNLAGAGDGGAIRLARINGEDVAQVPTTPNLWHRVALFNNIIVNNVAGLAGGAISLQDVANSLIVHNTIANNDSTATAGEAFAPGSPNQSTPQVGGIVSRAHSLALAGAFGAGFEQEFSNPTLVNNIIWHNRSFYFVVDDTLTPPYRLLPDIGEGQEPVYNDLAVVGTETPESLNPLYCVLTDTTGYSGTNISEDPDFRIEYINGAKNQIIIPEATTIQAAPAFDEGGNFIDVRFGPLTTIDPDTGLPFGDYHITATSPAINLGLLATGAPFVLRRDFDVQIRPNGARPDSGADEFYP